MAGKKIAVFISGRGSNLGALLAAKATYSAYGEIALVVSNKAQAGGLNLAKTHHIPHKIINAKDYADKTGFDAALHQACLDNDIDLICLAGFMRVLSADFVEKWEGRLINIHPSLLPSFKGLDTHKRALEAGVCWHGASVHFVTAGVDEGPLIGQAIVPVYNQDAETDLASRVLEQEHVLYPLALRHVLAGDIVLKDGQVKSTLKKDLETLPANIQLKLSN